MTADRHLHPVTQPHDDHDPTERTPRDLTERALLGALLNNPTARDQATQLIQGQDFHQHRYQLIFDSIVDLYASGHPVDPITVADHLNTQLPRIGGLPELLTLAAAGYAVIDPTYYANIIARQAARDRLDRAAIAIHQLATQPGDDTNPADLHAAALTHLQAAATRIPGIEPYVPGDTIDVFLAADPNEEPDWLIPDFLERRDRIIVTAAEGGGKSTLLRQWAVQTALGEHPFTGEPFTPARVLLLDLENSERQIRRSLRPLRLAARGINPEHLIIVCKGDGLDLTKTADTTWLDQLIAAHRPDLLVTGPLYKLAGGNPNDEADAKPAALAIDTLRTRHDIAVVIEAHSRKGESTHPRHRPKEPFGWSGWMRWPEFGIHVGADGEITHWRGQRDADRPFPEWLHRGGKWPWMPGGRPDSHSGDFRPTILMERVSRFIESHPGTVKTEIEKQVRGKGVVVRQALQLLIDEGWIAEEVGPGRTRYLREATPFRAADTDGQETDE